MEQISDDDMQKLFEIERKLKSKNNEQSETSKLLSYSTTIVSGEIKNVPKPYDGDIEISIDVGDKTFKQRIKYRTAEQEDNSELVRLLNYCGLTMREITELKGQTVPVRKQSDYKFEIAIPENINSVSVKLFHIWQTLIKYNVVKQKKIGNSYSRDYKLSFWSISVISAIFSILLYFVSMFSSSQDAELLVFDTITTVSFIASISLLILSATIATTIFLRGISRALGVIKSKVLEFISF